MMDYCVYPVKVPGKDGKHAIVWRWDLSKSIVVFGWGAGEDPPTLNRWWEDPPQYKSIEELHREGMKRLHDLNQYCVRKYWGMDCEFCDGDNNERRRNF